MIVNSDQAFKRGLAKYGSAKNSEFKESEHPRSADGKFGSGGAKSKKETEEAIKKTTKYPSHPDDVAYTKEIKEIVKKHGPNKISKEKKAKWEKEADHHRQEYETEKDPDKKARALDLYRSLRLDLDTTIPLEKLEKTTLKDPSYLETKISVNPKTGKINK